MTPKIGIDFRGHAQIQFLTASFARPTGRAKDAVEAARELKLIRSLLAPEGRLLLFFEPPSADQITTIERAVSVRLKAASYVVKQSTYGPSPRPPLLGIIAGLA